MEEQLRGEKASEEEKQQVDALLKQFYELSDSEDSDDVSETLAEQIKKVIVGFVFLISRLYPKKCQSEEDVAEILPSKWMDDFHHQLSLGFHSEIVSVFCPWWEKEGINIRLAENGMPLILPNDKACDFPDGVDPLNDLPAAPREPLPELRSLTKKTISPSIPWQLIQVLSVSFLLFRYKN